MRLVSRRVLVPPAHCAQTPLTWQQVQAKFEAANPTLRAGQLNIQESKAQEITAYLRPNPNLTAGLDQFDPFTGNPYRPLGYAFPLRRLRLSARAAAQARAAPGKRAEGHRHRRIAATGPGTQPALQPAQRLRRRPCRPRPCWRVAKENLDYFDNELAINRDRFQAGDIARVDLDRLELQRVQYESDFQTAHRQRCAPPRSRLLTLLNDRTPVDQFDVTGPFDFREPLTAARRVPRQAALAARPDLKAAMQAVDKAQTDHKLAVANGSTDPDLRRGLRAQSADPGLHRVQRQHPAAHLRPQPGGEGAHANSTSSARRAAAGGRRGAGLQRRGFGLPR